MKALCVINLLILLLILYLVCDSCRTACQIRDSTTEIKQIEQRLVKERAALQEIMKGVNK